MMNAGNKLNKQQGAAMREVGLNELAAGESAEIVSFASAGKAGEKLLRLGVVPGISLEVNHVSPDSGPVEITIRVPACASPGPMPIKSG